MCSSCLQSRAAGSTGAHSRQPLTHAGLQRRAPQGPAVEQSHALGSRGMCPTTCTNWCYHEAWMSTKKLGHPICKDGSSPSSISQATCHLLFPNLPSRHSSVILTPVPGSHVQLPFGPCPTWGKSPCRSSPCSISSFLLSLNLTSHFTQQDFSQGKLFLNSCLAIICSTPGDSQAQAGKPEGELSR